MQTLNASPLKDHDVSKLLYNRPKNRFANIFPCEYTAAVSSVQCGLWPACHCAVCPLACMSLCSVSSGLHVTVQCGLWPACHCVVWPLACMSLYSVASGLHVTVQCSCPLSSDDESRVLLEEIPGEEGSDYINASWIDVNAAIIYS